MQSKNVKDFCVISETIHTDIQFKFFDDKHKARVFYISQKDSKDILRTVLFKTLLHNFKIQGIVE